MELARWTPAAIFAWPVALVWPATMLLALLPLLPTTIPPLVDVPGHIGRFAIQTAPAGSALHRFFAFHWALRPNLGTDLLVAALYPMLGVIRATWLVVAALPPLCVGAIALLARARNRYGAAAATWALPFAYSYPFSFGFLNYTLGMILSLGGFALWTASHDRPRRREALFWVLIPVLLVCHLMGGGLLLLLIVADALGQAWADREGWRKPALALRPLLAALPLLGWWRIEAGSAGFGIGFSLAGKASALLFALRDQLRWLDIASIVAVTAVPLVGAALGARYRRADAVVVVLLGLLFAILPGEIGGASAVDMRLLPPFAICVIVLQDWSRVRPGASRLCFAAGLALFDARIAATTAGFVRYDRDYRAEAGALAAIRPGSTILAFVTRQCRPSRSWRMDRLDHFPALGTATRDAWVNAHWDVGDLQLLTIRFRPSADFYDDPSHYVWPGDCTHRDEPIVTAIDRRNRRRTIEEVMPELPLASVDYLWLIDTALPAGPWVTALHLAWTNGRSALYATAGRGAVSARGPRGRGVSRRARR